MDDLKDIAKRIPWWLWVIIAFMAAVILAPQQPTAVVQFRQEPSDPEPKEATEYSITPAELIEFDNVVFDLDPGQRLVTDIAKAPNTDEIVDVAVTLEFVAMSQVEQGEVAIAMRDALSKICECSPYLKFQTEGGQRVVGIGRKEPEFE